MPIENDLAAWERYNAALETLNQASARFRDLRHLPDHHRDRVKALDAVIRAHVALDKAGDEIGWGGTRKLRNDTFARPTSYLSACTGPPLGEQAINKFKGFLYPYLGSGPAGYSQARASR
jgi:hypothetical protein